MLTLSHLKTCLDEDQFQAVTAPKGNILCVANAGSGKTRVLTHRIAWQIEQGEPEDSFIMLTFTVKAAKEMRERICQLLGKQQVSIVSGTFHSVAWRFLKRYGGLLKLPRDLVILDETDSSDLFGLCREHYCAFNDGDRKAMPSKDVIAKFYSYCRNTQTDMETYLDETVPFPPKFFPMVLGVIDTYEKRKKANHTLDFDDLIILFDKLLDVEDFQQVVQAKYPNIFVDEFQDINAVQASIIKKLSSFNNRLTAVGDDAQCIYNWRGSDISFIRNFQKEYASASIYPIRYNYRSLSPIVDLALAVINESPDYIKQPKQMRSVQPSQAKPAYTIYKGFYAEKAMTDAIISRVQELHQSGVPYDEITILFRTNRLPRLLEAKLSAANVPVSMECSYPFYSRAHIRPILNYLRFMINPANELAFWSLVSLLEGVGQKTAQKMFEAFSGYKFDIEVLDRLAAPKKASSEFGRLAAAIKVGTDRIKNPSSLKTASMPQQLMELFYRWFMKTYMERQYGDKDSDKELKSRLHDFQIMYDAMEGLALEDYLSNVSLTTDKEAAKGGAVRMTTVHKAKGLEWDHVIIPYANDQVFPISYDVMEEERRLFYVAVTRARKGLDLYSCRGSIQNWPNFAGDESPFLIGGAAKQIDRKRIVQAR